MVRQAICHEEGINAHFCDRWSKDFLEAGKKRPSGNTARKRNSKVVSGIRKENHQLRPLATETSLKNRVLKKLNWFGIEIGRFMKLSQTEKMMIIGLYTGDAYQYLSSPDEGFDLNETLNKSFTMKKVQKIIKNREQLKYHI